MRTHLLCRFLILFAQTAGLMVREGDCESGLLGSISDYATHLCNVGKVPFIVLCFSLPICKVGIAPPGHVVWSNKAYDFTIPYCYRTGFYL